MHIVGNMAESITEHGMLKREKFKNFVSSVYEAISLTVIMLNFLNGTIHLVFLVLSIINFWDIKLTWLYTGGKGYTLSVSEGYGLTYPLPFKKRKVQDKSI